VFQKGGGKGDRSVFNELHSCFGQPNCLKYYNQKTVALSKMQRSE
jgi:hypothetical protein